MMTSWIEWWNWTRTRTTFNIASFIDVNVIRCTVYWLIFGSILLIVEFHITYIWNKKDIQVFDWNTSTCSVIHIAFHVHVHVHLVQRKDDFGPNWTKRVSDFLNETLWKDIYYLNSRIIINQRQRLWHLEEVLTSSFNVSYFFRVNHSQRQAKLTCLHVVHSFISELNSTSFALVLPLLMSLLLSCLSQRN